MTAATQTIAPAATDSPTKFSGDIVYMFAFDLAYDMKRVLLPTLLGQPLQQFEVDASKRSPRQILFYKPRMAKLPPLERVGPRGPIKLEQSVKLLPVGAISITIRIPFQVDSLADLVAFHDLRFSDDTYLYDHVQQIAKSARDELMPYLTQPISDLEEEAYTVFCIHGPLPQSPGATTSTAEEWLHHHRREVAGLLTEESNPLRLSQQETEESTARFFSYYERDLVVIDWDAALIIDEPRYFDEVLHILELANVQLAELEAYDRVLDGSIERSYRDVRPGRPWSILGARNVQRDLREIRIDLARLSDELQNTTKFLGDWHLARIYQGIATRFHLGDWYRTIDEKLKTLDDLYQILRADQNNRTMLILEVTIVLLFIIDLVILGLGLAR